MKVIDAEFFYSKHLSRITAKNAIDEHSKLHVSTLLNLTEMFANQNAYAFLEKLDCQCNQKQCFIHKKYLETLS